MAEVTLTATMDESHILHLQVPPEIRVGELEVVVREKHPKGSIEALWQAVESAPKVDDPDFWERARQELFRSREED